jgi:hypothetical protein
MVPPRVDSRNSLPAPFPRTKATARPDRLAARLTAAYGAENVINALAGQFPARLNGVARRVPVAFRCLQQPVEAGRQIRASRAALS